MATARLSFRYLFPYLFTWAAQLGLWLIYADSVNYREVIAGAIGAAISTAFVWRFMTRDPEHYQVRARDLVPAVHIPAMLVKDTWTVLRATARGLRGERISGATLVAPFRGGGDDPESRGRRALAITYLTLTPNSLVLDISPKQKTLLFHALVPGPLPRFVADIEAEPAEKLRRTGGSKRGSSE